MGPLETLIALTTPSKLQEPFASFNAFQAQTRIVRITSLSLINEEQSRESGRYIVVFVGQVNYFKSYFAVNLVEK